MISKKGLEMSFSTIFAIIVGAAILFLAIYFASSLTEQGEESIDARTGAKLSILLDPLETSMGESKSNKLTFGSETRIYNDKCQTGGNFGEQRIGIASYSFGKWKEPTYGKKQYNKYIFSQETEESKDYYVFAKPLFLPYKVSDIIILTGEKYCFINAPDSVKRELEGLSIDNFNFAITKSNCTSESRKVCFSSSGGCDITVYGEYGFSQGYVEKERRKLEYADNLLYAAVFSSPEVYDCNVKRLKMRLTQLALIYKDEIRVLERKGCYSNLDAQLNDLINLANSNSSLVYLKEKSEQIKTINEAAECKIFENG
jgi:hypothetical protein